MSVILGLISGISLIVVMILTYRARGEAATQYGMVALLALIMAVVGVILGYRADREKDRYYFFPRLGMILNGMVLVGELAILFASV